VQAPDGYSKDCIDIRYYILSKELAATRFAAAVASHWAIPNQLYWLLDATCRKDHCRVRKGPVTPTPPSARFGGRHAPC